MKKFVLFTLQIDEMLKKVYSLREIDDQYKNGYIDGLNDCKFNVLKILDRYGMLEDTDIEENN